MRVNPAEPTFRALEAVYRGAVPEFGNEWRAGVARSAAAIEKAAKGDSAVYGVNTGFGKLASVRIPPADVERLQRNLVVSHCAGLGDLLPDDVVRLAMTLKVCSLARGASGVRPELVDFLAEMLRRGVVPEIPSQGSVGASGDLAPLAHLAAAMMGEGRSRLDGKPLASEEALRRSGLAPLAFRAKEGLAMVNGTQVSAALALGGLFDAWRIAVSSLTTGAMSTDAAMGSSAPFRPEIHELRGHQGQKDAAAALRSLLANSEIRESHRHGDERVQDPYCLRCQPQVLGAALTLMRQAGAVLRIEAGSVTDNPLVLEDGTILSGGNFHGEPVGLAADQIAIAVSETGAISQRRIALLVDPAMSFGLPAFLTDEPGLNSGLMITDISSAALASENKALSNPRSVDSTPTSANQEDHVAMSCHAARRLLEMNRNLARIVAIEAVCAAQGLEYRAPLRTSEPLRRAAAVVRKVSPRLRGDRALAGELEEVAELVLGGMLVPEDAPSLEVGP